MAKVRKGATVVLRLDELNLWIRRLHREMEKEKQNGKMNGSGNGQSNQHRKAISRFKIVNRALDFNKLPPCRGKIVYMGIPKFLKQKKVVFGIQLYPPYFGLSQRVFKSINTRKVLGKISIKDMRAPMASIWFITEKDIKGVMLKAIPRRMSKGATQMTNHMGSPNIFNSNASQHVNHLNMKSSRSHSHEDELKESDDIHSNGCNGSSNVNQNRNHFTAHFRRKSSYSAACHYRNIESVANVSNLDTMFWEDQNLPSDYSLGKRSTVTTTGIIRRMEEDPRERRFKLDRWLYPIFLDFNDHQTTEIVKDRCQWELTQWIRDESEGLRTPTLRAFYDYMISISENLDAIFLASSEQYLIENSKNGVTSSQTHTLQRSESELWSIDETNFQFEMMVRIKDLTECVEDAIEAQFVLDVLDALDNDLFFASPVIQSILKCIGNDIRFMGALRQSCHDPEKAIKILQSMERYNKNGSLLPSVWKLMDATQGDEIMVERILMNTDNLKQSDPEILCLGVYKGCNLDLSVAIPAFESVTSGSNEYIYRHLIEIMMLCRSEMSNDKSIDPEKFINFAISHPLVAPYELLTFWRQNASLPLIDQLNLLSSMQINNEQCQLFLGRYLLYCPFQTKAVVTGQFDDYKKDQDEVEFYDEDEVDDDDDTTALLFEITLDVDQSATDFTKKCIIKRCLCVKNHQTLEYEPDHYYEDELVHQWKVTEYQQKILTVNNTRCQWIPNLSKIKSINPSYNVDFNPEDLSNEFRGYLVLLPDEDGKLVFVNDLFKEWNGKNQNKGHNKYTEAIHKMLERPLFVSMEKWKLTDNY